MSVSEARRLRALLKRPGFELVASELAGIPDAKLATCVRACVTDCAETPPDLWAAGNFDLHGLVSLERRAAATLTHQQRLACLVVGQLECGADYHQAFAELHFWAGAAAMSDADFPEGLDGRRRLAPPVRKKLYSGVDKGGAAKANLAKEAAELAQDAFQSLTPAEQRARGGQLDAKLRRRIAELAKGNPALQAAASHVRGWSSRTLLEYARAVQKPAPS